MSCKSLLRYCLKILNLSEILPVYLVATLYLSVTVTDAKYCIVGQVQGAVES